MISMELKGGGGQPSYPDTILGYVLAMVLIDRAEIFLMVWGSFYKGSWLRPFRAISYADTYKLDKL
ncbi:MAG: hypothetical protein QXQ57_07880 [Sulfolobales archaeon]